ncbi:MAG: hypothetical protein JOY60_14440 [Burkholderiaceae bacterium]|nr:hypothetical protein [Roseateles sp.]MBV8471046.1 hypothetical protein [Burkholderiaceae bacterium]
MPTSSDSWLDPSNAALQAGSGASRASYLEALRELLLNPPACHQLIWLDRDFASWPLSEQLVLDALTQWAKPQRQLLMLADDFEGLRRAHPRFVSWRQRHDHVVQARQLNRDDGPLAVPGSTCMAADHGVLQLLDQRYWRWTYGTDVRVLHELKLEFDALAQRCAESFPASTLGL